ncbi:MAG: hypothetical protein EOP83_12820, partial [Verrucomicrobiaceae bacterium]
MKFTGSFKPLSNSKVRLGQRGVIRVLWDTATGILDSVYTGQGITKTVKATATNGSSVVYTLYNSTLPAGLSLNPATGVVTGISNTAGVIAFTVRATAGIHFADRTFAITVNPLTVTWQTPQILGAVPAGIASLTQLVAVTNDGAPVSYRVISGNLPNGLAMTTSGAIVGKAENQNTVVSFTVRATRSGGSIFSDRLFTIQVLEDVITWATPAGLLGSGLGGAAFASALSATSNTGNGNVTYSVIYGTLPSGLSLNPTTGAITGTLANINGTSLFRIRATDGYGYADREFTIGVNADVITWATASGVLAEIAGGQTVLLALSASSNTPGRLVNSYTLVSGALPTGLSLNTSTGAITGVAANITALAQFIIRASNGVGFADRAFQINITPEVVTWVTPENVTFNSNEEAYASLLAVSSTAQPVSYQRVSGTVPTGLALAEPTATIQGTATTPTTTTLTMRAKTRLAAADRNFTVAVNGPPVWQTISGNIGTVSPGQQFAYWVQATDPDGIGSYTFVANATLGETVRLTKPSANVSLLTGYVGSPPEDNPPTWATNRVLPVGNEGFSANVKVTATPFSGRTISRYQV